MLFSISSVKIRSSLKLSHTLGLIPDSLLVLTAIGLAVVNVILSLVPQVTVGDLCHISIVLDVQIAASLLGADKGQQDDVGVDGAHEDADDLSVVVALDRLAVLVQWLERIVLTKLGFDGRGCGRCQVAQLVRSADHEGTERAR